MSDLTARRFEIRFIGMLNKRVGDIDPDVRSIIAELLAATPDKNLN